MKLDRKENSWFAKKSHLGRMPGLAFALGWMLVVSIATLVVSTSVRIEAQTLQTLALFTGTNGLYPRFSLVAGNDGNLYGTTTAGGDSGKGTFFRLTSDGSLTTLASFQTDTPSGPLALGLDGNFYGMAMPSNGFWSVVRAGTNGAVLTLASFMATNGTSPPGQLVLGGDGSFYGTTLDFNLDVTVVRVSTNGQVSTVGSLNYYAGNVFPLVLGEDGAFYGTTVFGGSGYGTVFKVTTNGVLNPLVYFDGTNAAYPSGGLILGNDGNFYGTTGSGGDMTPPYTSGRGTIFKMTSEGTLSRLAFFTGNDGMFPEGELTLGKDGNFYGVTMGDGTRNYGTVFLATTNGALLTLAHFDVTNGASPVASLAFGSDDNLYGTTPRGGATNLTDTIGEGTLFRLALPPVMVISQPQHQTNYAGTTARFSVVATSANPFVAQWQKDGTNLVDGGRISGVTNSTLTLADVLAADAGTYNVVLSNKQGVVTSSSATLTVINVPVIVTQPTNEIGFVGYSTTFTVSAYGAPPFVFQWYFNGAPLGSAVAGTNFSSYTLSNLRTNQAGSYSVKIINAYGSTNSVPASLRVLPAPLLTLRLSAGYAILDLSAVVSNNYVLQYSADLTNWTDLLSLNNLPYSPYLFLDPAGVGQTARFYRTLVK